MRSQKERKALERRSCHSTFLCTTSVCGERLNCITIVILLRVFTGCLAGYSIRAKAYRPSAKTLDTASTMKIDRRRTHVLLLLLTSLASSQSTSANAAAEAKSLAAPRAVGDSSQPAAGIRAAPVGTEHAPVDGKDGMPHEGPFIETEGDRSRKKGSDQEETLGGKVLPSGTPKTNDGVMDDPARRGPLAGTRGTEGGVTEKTKDGQIVDRQPQRPKEQPPLPHSEKEKAQGSEGEAVFIEEDGTKKTLTVRQRYYVCSNTKRL